MKATFEINQRYMESGHGVENRSYSETLFFSIALVLGNQWEYNKKEIRHATAR